ncbi:MAG: hypothetical protein MUC72_07215 [Acidobacteria bacterium]|jgi:hypothetical protein|nr:hypothetical protein [Acidobacteriota bacterium]
MLKKILLPLLAAAAFSCAPPQPQLAPGPSFHYLGIKFSFRDEGVRQNGRVLWRFDDQGAKFLFFTPLNQLGLELDVAGEQAVLVNFSKKAYWQGDFAGLLERLWGIGLTLSELKSLLLAGAAPPAEFAGRGIAVLMERPGDAGAPEAVRLRRGSAELLLRITRKERRPGRIELVDYAGRFRAADLDSVLEQ